GPYRRRQTRLARWRSASLTARAGANPSPAGRCITKRGGPTAGSWMTWPDVRGNVHRPGGEMAGPAGSLGTGHEARGVDTAFVLPFAVCAASVTAGRRCATVVPVPRSRRAARPAEQEEDIAGKAVGPGGFPGLVPSWVATVVAARATIHGRKPHSPKGL